MNIAHVGNFKENSANGVNQVIFNIATRQSLMGHNVYIYSFANVNDIKRTISKNGVVVVEFPKSYLKGFILNNKFKKYIINNQDNLDLIHLHSVFTPSNNMIAKIIKFPYVITPHGGYSTNCYKRNIISSIKKEMYYLLFEKRYIMNSKAIQCLNENEKFQLRYLNKIDYKINIIPNGVENRLNFLNNKGKDKDTINLLFLGRLDMVHKGLDILIEGLYEFNKLYNEKNVKLWIVGPDVCNHKKVLQSKVKKYNLQDKVEFKDKVIGAEKEYILSNEADVFVHTSRWEGAPIAVLEALSFGLPVIVSKETNIGDYIEEYNAGWVLNDNTPKFIAKTIKSILEIDISKYRENAYKLAKTEFDWQLVVDKLISMYNNSIT